MKMPMTNTIMEEPMCKVKQAIHISHAQQFTVQMNHLINLSSDKNDICVNHHTKINVLISR